MHDCRALRQVGAEPHTVGVADAHAGRDHIVDHTGHLVDEHDFDVGTGGAVDGVRCGRLYIHLAQGEIFDRERAVVRPDDVREHAEDAVKIDGVRLCQAQAQQVQTQVGIGCIRGGCVQIADRENRDASYPACVGLFADESVEPGCRAVGWRWSGAEGKFRIPHVERGAGGVDACQSPSPCGALVCHDILLLSGALRCQCPRGLRCPEGALYAWCAYWRVYYGSPVIDRRIPVSELRCGDGVGWVASGRVVFVVVVFGG